MAYPIWQATITDDNGNVLPGAEITVVNETTGLNAPLYSTRNGTSKSNPFFATVDGFAQFYAAPGLYRITATDGGTGTTQTFRYVRLVEVATTAEAIAGTAGVLPDAEQVRLVIAQDVPSASTTVAGRVEKATNQEALDGVVDKFPDAAGVHAAFKQFGLGASDVPTFPLSTDKLRFFRIAPDDPDNPFSSPTAGNAGLNIYIGGTFGCQIAASASSVDAGKIFFRNRLGNTYVAWRELWHSGNTTVDGNGFIKAASPIVSLYKDRAESNGSAELEGMQFERIATGHYRLTGVPELSRDGWYIETPKDRNGNIYFTIDYDESVEGELTIRTYEPDYSTGRATNGDPVDIIDGRFVSLRFIEIPELHPTPDAAETEDAQHEHDVN